MKKSAIVFGATGLVGSHLINILISDNRYDQIKVFTRRKLTIKNPKIKEYVIDLFHIKNYSENVKGDDLFYCIGTTSKKSKSKEEYREIEYQLPLNIAKIATKNNIQNFVIISSIGANAMSKSLYLQNKGELEDVLLKLSLNSLIILRPSLLLGKRSEFRIWEELGKYIFYPFSFLMFGKFKKYRPIKASDVAKCMIKMANIPNDKKIFECNEMLEYLKK